jgi:hypothetical protein
MVRRQFLAVAALAAITALITPTSSQAGFKITLSEGNNSIVITDGGANDFSGVNGVIATAQSFGSFSFVANLASSNSAGGTAPAILTINNLTINALAWWGGGTRTLTITVEDTNFNAPGVGPANVTSNLSGWSIPGGQATYQSFLDNQAGTLLEGNGTANNNMFIGDTPYTLRSVLTITMGANGIAQGLGSTVVNGESGGVNHAPAPSGLILAATALPFLGLLRRRLGRAETGASPPA